ncbi:MAG: 50S ribosomal protein L18 [Acidobacteriota bacterium]|nr:MAG: 50S ribosomal protein L18 [Acidobacteriota bacterium]
MIKIISRNELRKKRHFHTRKRMVGTSQKPRLCVYKSHKYIYAQAVDDLNGRTMAAASSLEKEARGVFLGHANKAAAKWVGERLSGRLAAGGVASVVFDRSGYAYHGVVKELADAVRGQGIKL